MKTNEFKKLIRECIEEVLIENVWDSPDESLKVYTDVNQWINDNIKDGVYIGEPLKNYGFTYKRGDKVNMGVGHLTLAMRVWNDSKKKRNDSLKSGPPAGFGLREMSTTGGVAGFTGKNWVDPDPKRKKMKNIAAKSVGGKLA